MDEKTLSVITTSYINGAVGVIVLIIYLFFRLRIPDIFSPRFRGSRVDILNKNILQENINNEGELSPTEDCEEYVQDKNVKDKVKGSNFVEAISLNDDVFVDIAGSFHC